MFLFVSPSYFLQQNQKVKNSATRELFQKHASKRQQQHRAAKLHKNNNIINNNTIFTKHVHKVSKVLL